MMRTLTTGPKGVNIRGLCRTPSGLTFEAAPHGVAQDVRAVNCLTALKVEGDVEVAECRFGDSFVAVLVAGPVDHDVVRFHIRTIASVQP